MIKEKEKDDDLTSIDNVIERPFIEVLILAFYFTENIEL